jgi:hypothetical protein
MDHNRWQRAVTTHPQALKRLAAQGDADAVEWERLVTDNVKLQLDLRVLRGKYGLPITEGRLTGETAQRLWSDLSALRVKHRLPEKWRLHLYLLAVFGELGQPSGIVLPVSRSRQLGDGTVKHELIITPETDLDNPLVREFIKLWQEEHRDLPPQPQPVLGNTRKLDWRPVLEWKKRHPWVTHGEIDAMLGYAPGSGRTRRKLAELESRTGAN